MSMNFSTIMLGFFFGFGLGVGCALAVMYSIYAGGYRNAIRDSLLPVKPQRYKKLLQKAIAAREKQTSGTA